MLQAVSNTANGKNATPETQTKVLQIVRSLETTKPPSPNLLTDPELAKPLLDGVWYLQYTSPSQIGGDENKDAFPDAWKPQYAESNIPTTQFQAQGTVTAAGIKVDTSNKVVQQIFNVEQQTVTNLITLDWGTVRVGGSFRPSEQIPNRAIAAFDTAVIQLGKGEDDSSGPKINLGFVFDILALARGSKDSGWLETTYVDESLRIGRGNKGTMFVLTRDPNDVQP